MGADDVCPDQTVAAASVDEDTAVVPDAARTEAAELAWSQDDGTAAVADAKERRPLPRSLKLLLAGVVVGVLALLGNTGLVLVAG